MKTAYPVCPENRQECFANWRNKCRILTDTSFKDGKPCPFYKRKNQVDPEISENEEDQRNG